MFKTYEEFKEFTNRPGAKVTITFAFMREGCPKCGSKKWQVTMDGWAYCEGCSRGYPTDMVYSNWLDILDFSSESEVKDD